MLWRARWIVMERLIAVRDDDMPGELKWKRPGDSYREDMQWSKFLGPFLLRRKARYWEEEFRLMRLENKIQTGLCYEFRTVKIDKKGNPIDA